MIAGGAQSAKKVQNYRAAGEGQHETNSGRDDKGDDLFLVVAEIIEPIAMSAGHQKAGDVEATITPLSGAPR